MRRLVLSVLCGVGFVVLPAGVAAAADFVVNDSGEAGDAVKGNGVCATAGGVCTLRAAVEEAEVLTGGDKITIPAMTITLGSPLTITKTVTVQGAGGRSTIVTGSPGHILIGIGGGDIQIRDLALQGATSNGSGYGLAILQNGNAATTLERVRVVGNSVTGSSTVGAPLWLAAGEMTVRNSEVSGNTATSTSTSAFGAGIYMQGLTTALTVENSTIHGNTATAGGGSAWGGGLMVGSGTATIRSSTITSNVATNSVSISASGGNVYASSGGVTIRDSIVAFGVADLTGFGNCQGSPTFQGRNIVSDISCGAASATLTVADPKLGLLQDNGGGTNSRTPAPGSPALNALPTCAVAVDQRGQQRPIDGGCELGSVEVGADVSVSQSVSNAAPAPGSDVVITATVGNKGADAAAGGRFSTTLQNVQSIVSVSVSDGSCAVNGANVSCDLGVLQRTGPRTILMVVRAPRSGTLSSTATVSSDLPDPNRSDNSNVVSVDVPGVASGTACSNVIKGSKKADRLRGTSKGDRISGLGRDDVLRGLGGADCLNGGKGDDRVLGGAGGDKLTGSKGRDVLLGGAGNDVLRSRDGVRDVVKCGAGQDRVIADRKDRVAKDCEQVAKK
jgi:hypothetical protein